MVCLSNKKCLIKPAQDVPTLSFSTVSHNALAKRRLPDPLKILYCMSLRKSRSFFHEEWQMWRSPSEVLRAQRLAFVIGCSPRRSVKLYKTFY